MRCNCVVLTGAGELQFVCFVSIRGTGDYVLSQIDSCLVEIYPEHGAITAVFDPSQSIPYYSYFVPPS